jgi:hypothetical protein
VHDPGIEEGLRVADDVQLLDHRSDVDRRERAGQLHPVAIDVGPALRRRVLAERFRVQIVLLPVGGDHASADLRVPRAADPRPGSHGRRREDAIDSSVAVLGRAAVVEDVMAFAKQIEHVIVVVDRHRLRGLQQLAGRHDERRKVPRLLGAGGSDRDETQQKEGRGEQTAAGCRHRGPPAGTVAQRHAAEVTASVSNGADCLTRLRLHTSE